MGSRMRLTHQQTAERRSHHALEETRLSTCKDCGAKHKRHQMCGECGRYKGRLVVDVAAKAQKKAERLARKARAYGEEVPTEGRTPTVDEAKPEKEESTTKSKKASPKEKGTNVETKKEDK